MNILLTSVGRRTYLVQYFKEIINRTGKVHAANSVYTYAMSEADNYTITPLIYDEKYISFLYDYCVQYEINLIISLFDIDLTILARNKTKFEEIGIQVIVSNPLIVEMCNDKWLTYQFLLKYDFLTPKSFIELDDGKKALDDENLAFPLIVKPRWGMGSIGVYRVNNLEELDVLYQKVKNEVFDSYLRYESHLDPDRSVIVQECLVGDEYGLDVFNDLNGKFLTCIPKKKLAMRAGETDSAEIINEPLLFDLGNSISNRTMHIGNLDIDVFRVEGKYYILEMNCRFGGQYPFSHLAGVNFPKAIVDMATGKKIDLADLTAEYGTVGVKDMTIKRIRVSNGD